MRGVIDISFSATWQKLPKRNTKRYENKYSWLEGILNAKEHDL